MVQLRPLGIGGVLDAAIRLYVRNAVTMWTIVAVVIVPLAILQEIVVLASLPAGAQVHGGVLATPSGTASSAAGAVAEIVLGLIGVLIVNGALALCLVDAHLGQPLDWRQSLRAAAHQLGPLLWLAIVYGIAVGISFVLFIVAGIWLSVMWSVAVPAVMFERLNGFRALGRSFTLVRGRWWATFGALLVAVFLLFIALIVVQLILGAIESGLGVGSTGVWAVFGGLASILSDLIAYPFIGSVIAVIYIDLRVRREPVDLRLLAGTLRGPVR